LLLAALLAGSLGSPVVTSSSRRALAAEAGPGGLFVLPVDRVWPTDESAGRVFEERIAIALAETKRVRPLAPRDIAEGKRGSLPKDLASCVTPACLKRLGEATGAERVLGTRLADDAGRPTLFASVYEARTGAILQRREWPGSPDAPPVSARLAAEVARWSVGEPAPAAPQTAPPPAAPRAPEPGLLSVDLAPGEPDSSQARALADALAAALATRDGFSVVPRGTWRANATHRAVIRVEEAHVSLRPHHAEHVREGSLAAVVTVVELPTEAVVFTTRAHAERSIKSRKTGDAEVMAALVDDVVAQWMAAFQSQAVAGKIRKKGSR
jgi:hypothetical protein